MKTYYFAYGLHMRREEMEIAIPGHQVYGLAYLENYQLVFNTYTPTTTLANISDKSHSKVYGLLYEIKDTDLQNLDHLHPSHKRIQKKIFIPGIKAYHLAYLYEAKTVSPEEKPGLAYVYKLFHAARLIPGYNPRYLGKLEEWLINLRPEL